ncbi:MAG: hypothetical protein ACD_72C00004G0001 [uncultured bacterium]|nr:MAG: hypothetical protein ACD_72C00004G0001 [uncultured bacterium]
MNFTNIKKIILLILISNIFYPLVVSAAEPWAGLATVSTNNKEDYNKYCNATGATDNVKMMRCDITVFDPKGIPTKFQFDAIKTSYTDFLLVDDRRNDVDVKLKLNYTPNTENYSLTAENFYLKKDGASKSEYGQASCEIVTHCCCAQIKDTTGNVVGVDEKKCKQTFCDCPTTKRDISFCGVKPKPVSVGGEPAPTPEVTDIIKDLKITKPILEISLPKLKFSDVKNTLYTAEDGTNYIYIPYIGEYVTTVYQFGMVAINIIAVIMIITIGVKITTLGGEQRVEGFKKIGQIAIGLFIAWGSYILLFTINPDLINFKSLKIQYTTTKPIAESTDDGGEETDAVKLEIDKTVKKGSIPCDFPIENGLEKIPPIPGIRFAGKKDKDYLLPSVIVGLKRLGEVATKNGYVIAITTACRDLASQTTLAKSNSVGVAGGTVAHPGKSPHGYGYAIDVELIKDGVSLTHATTGHATDGIQCSYPKEHPEALEAIKKQSEIFFEAGWTRLINESWHYEYGTAGKAFRSQCKGYASPCKQDGPDDCKA